MAYVKSIKKRDKFIVTKDGCSGFEKGVVIYATMDWKQEQGFDPSFKYYSGTSEWKNLELYHDTSTIKKYKEKE